MATEAVQGLIDYAFNREEVRAVNPNTLGETNASNRVLQKVGMRFMSEVAHSQLGTIFGFIGITTWRQCQGVKQKKLCDRLQ